MPEDDINMSRIYLVDKMLRFDANSKPLWNILSFISLMNRYKTYIQCLNIGMHICIRIKCYGRRINELHLTEHVHVHVITCLHLTH